MTNTVDLPTNDSAKRLSLVNVRLAAGHQDYLVADLHVLSRGFGCQDYPFCFDRFHADRFVALLEEMDRGKVGEAVLKQEWEIDQIRFENDQLGHLAITGVVDEGAGHRLSFALETDQTVLRPFTRDLRNALAAVR